METKHLEDWDKLNTTNKTRDSIETLMLEHLRTLPSNKGIPTKYFKDNFATIFGRTSTNPQPRLNKAMRALAAAEQAEIKQVAGRNYIRAVPIDKSGAIKKPIQK